MSAIPRRHRAEEFSLHIGWRPYTGQRDFKGIPGFHLGASFANEGEAQRIAQDVRLGSQALCNTLTMLAGDPNVPNELMNLGGPLSDAAEGALTLYHARLVMKARTLKAQLAEAEAAVAAAGLEGAV